MNFLFYLQMISTPEKQKRERETTRDRTISNLRSHHHPQPQIAPVSSHPSISEIALPEAPSRSHPSTGEIAPIVTAGSSSTPPSRLSPPKMNPPKTDLVLDLPKTELVLDIPILFSLLLNVADPAAIDHQPTLLHPQTHPIQPPLSSIHSDLSLSRFISLSPSNLTLSSSCSMFLF